MNMIAPPAPGTPVWHGDFWSDEVLLNPYPHYRELRELGGAVWLSQHDAWALTHHDTVRAALLDSATFSSARGCMMNEQTNEAMRGVMLCSDDPEHRQLRKIFSRPLMPAALAPLRQRLADLAREKVDELVAKREFDAVQDMAHFLPLTVVTDLVGLGEEGKAKMLHWASGIFNAFGPDTHARTLSGIEVTQQAFVYLQSMTRETLDPDGWGAALFDAAGERLIAPESAQAMLMDYLAPAIDTTINGMSSAVWLFAHYPDQWAALRADPALLPHAIDETLRLESPISAFSRYVTRDYEVGAVVIPAGSRALMLYACGNRDELQYLDADRFDISRKPRDHLAFGYGTHVCAGTHLAKLEMTVLLEALIKRVGRFHIVQEHREAHNTLRGLTKLVVRVEPA